MVGRYEEIRDPRFSFHHDDGADLIVIRPRKRVGGVLFFSFWLCVWTGGGATAIVQQWERHEPSLVFSIMVTAIGAVTVLLPMAWLIAGREIIRVTSTSLGISYRVAGWTRTRVFHAGEIRNMTVNAPEKGGEGGTIVVPFFGGYRSGSVKFDYGARTIHIAGELDESEGRVLAAHLREVLPSSAAAR